MIKITRSVAATTIFILALALIYYAHIRFLRVDVVFYSALLDGLLAAFLASCLLFWLGYFHVLGRFEKTLLLVIWLLAGYAFAISVPTVIDRSLSFYILEKLQQRGGAIPIKDFEDVFTREYVKEHRLVDVRITEQLESGTVMLTNDCVELTPSGQRLAKFSRFYRKNLLPKKRLLMGEYTDVLTDPFRDSAASAAPDCRMR